jgi:predicted nucleotidyltransferase
MRLPVKAVVLAGSVARGDFNVWSDIDIVVGYTPAELQHAALRGNRLVLDAAAEGILLAGDARAFQAVRRDADR